VISFLLLLSYGYSFSISLYRHNTRYSPTIGWDHHHPSPRIKSRLGTGSDDEWGEGTNDSNQWQSSEYNDKEDWKNASDNKADGSSWSSFEPSPEDDEKDEDSLSSNENNTDDNEQELDDNSELWLDTLAAISAEEVEFNAKENERANKAREMQEWGFDDETIKNTFGVEVDDTLETKDEVEGMQEYREDLYLEDEEDLTTVESHTKVPRDEDTGEPIRNQAVYVDEHACIGCYNCAVVADNTFFMEEEHGRARVFEQWGDDDDTIACAIETCPVDCIHYIPYDELVELELGRRGQNINAQARLVNEGSNANFGSAGGIAFSAPQEISGNFGSRCNNCPSRGCKSCPMFGVGKNPEFERRERSRKEKIQRNRLQKAREEEKKSVDL